MASEQQIQTVIQKLEAFHFEDVAKNYNNQKEGLKAVIKLLISEKGKLTAGAISEKLCISTARVAVLLKKMEARNLITKQKSKTDARVTIVELTEEGTEYANELRNSFMEDMGAVIDRVGMEKMESFIEVVGEIKNQIQIRENKKEENNTRE